MTALASRRRQHTVRAAMAVASSLAVALVLTVVGVVTLASSTLGDEVEANSLPTLRLPFTATAFIGIVDDEGVLRSAAMLALDPDGVGGSVVSVEATADIASNRSTEVISLRSGVATGGVDLFRLDAESISGVSFDVVTLLQPADLERLLAPIGPVEVTLPAPVADGSSGRSWSAGTATLDASEIAAILTASSDGVSSASLSPSRTAVWDGISTAVSGGVESLSDVFLPGELDPQAVPATISSFWRRLIAGSFDHRALRVEPIAEDRVPEGQEATFHDWSETLMVSAHVAPTRVAAPLDAATVRVIVPFGSSDLSGVDLTPVDLAVTAIDRLGLAGLNVVSVSVDDQSEASPPQSTLVWVGDETRVEEGAESFALLLGDVTAAVGDHRVDGVDVIITLGQSFVADIGRDIRPSLVGSVFDPDR